MSAHGFMSDPAWPRVVSPATVILDTNVRITAHFPSGQKECLGPRSPPEKFADNLSIYSKITCAILNIPQHPLPPSWNSEEVSAVFIPTELRGAPSFPSAVRKKNCLWLKVFQKALMNSLWSSEHACQGTQGPPAQREHIPSLRNFLSHYRILKLQGQLGLSGPLPYSLTENKLREKTPTRHLFINVGGIRAERKSKQRFMEDVGQVPSLSSPFMMWGMFLTPEAQTSCAWGDRGKD